MATGTSRSNDGGGSRKSRRGVARPGREAVLRRLRLALRDPSVGWGVLTAALFILIATIAGVWAQQRPLVSPGRVMDHTRAVRLTFKMEDAVKTDEDREQARRNTPRIFEADLARIDELADSIANLPRSLAGVSSIEEVAPELRARFGLDQSLLDAMLTRVVDGEPDAEWASASLALRDILRGVPLVDRETWQRFTQQNSSSDIILRGGTAPEQRVSSLRVVNMSVIEDLRRSADAMSMRAGFSGGFRPVVIARIAALDGPTVRDDEPATRAAQMEAASLVARALREVPEGEILYRRGEVLTPPAAQLLRAETEAFRREAPAWRVTPERLSLAATIGGVAVGLAGYIAFFCPRIRRNPTRAAAIAALGLGVVWISVLVAVFDPRLTLFAVVVPAVLGSMIIVVAYDQRTGLALGAGLVLIVGLVIDQPLARIVLAMVGVGVAVWQLREIRERHTLIRAGIMLAICLGGGALAIAFVVLPVSLDSVQQSLVDAGFLALGGLMAAGIVLFILPLLERAFDITTGLTLIELRDPKHALLRELQQRAPGTYNHSLNVASIAEAAADAVGADALLTYVGCLYHDVGKMTKPEYFVENQAGGPNKHDRLSPAMSLLVIVGHVKDGLEMAKEHNLPRAIEHFIEAHHGTTLVEYFFRRAVEQAKGDGSESVPEELSYRYPGPKPRSREVAIAMLSDAVESATRTLHEPTPSRIDALVRTLANKRLMDGQFDECDLTLKQLQIIVESVSKTVSAIYHGRIAYPGGSPAKRKTVAPGVPSESQPTTSTPATAPAPEVRAARGA